MGFEAVALAASNLSNLEPRLQGFESFVPSQACTALVEHALSSVIEQVESLVGQDIVCREFTRIDDHFRRRGDDAGSARIGFVLLDATDQIEARGWVRASASFWRDVDFSRTVARPSTRREAVPLQLSISLGECRVPISPLLELRPGDALRVTPKPPRRHDDLLVRLAHNGGRLGCWARLSGDALLLNTAMDFSMDTSASTPAADNNIANNIANNVECELRFELGSLSMTVAEIAQLRAGQSLRLGVYLQQQPVGILVGGRRIGRGELACVGDEVVVVVTETGGLPTV